MLMRCLTKSCGSSVATRHVVGHAEGCGEGQQPAFDRGRLWMSRWEQLLPNPTNLSPAGKFWYHPAALQEQWSSPKHTVVTSLGCATYRCLSSVSDLLATVPCTRSVFLHMLWCWATKGTCAAFTPKENSSVLTKTEVQSHLLHPTECSTSLPSSIDL